MSDVKTRPTGESVDDFIRSVTDEGRRDDCWRIIDIMRDATDAEPTMWGPAIIGFGEYRYRYESGREGDWFLTGFSPRKREFSLYVMGAVGRFDSIRGRLGKHRTGKSCLYVKRLSDIDIEVLRELVGASVAHLTKVQEEERG